MQATDNTARTIGYVAIGVAIVLSALVWFMYSTQKVEVTQLSVKTAAVFANAVQGVINTVALTDAADTEFDFAVNNTKVKVGSIILLETQYGGQANGFPSAYVRSIANGSFFVRVRNVGTAALNASTKIHFHVFN